MHREVEGAMDSGGSNPRGTFARVGALSRPQRNRATVEVSTSKLEPMPGLPVRPPYARMDENCVIRSVPNRRHQVPQSRNRSKN